MTAPGAGGERGAGGTGSAEELERLRGLAAWADELARPDLVLGRWHPSWTDDRGVMHLGWYELTEAGLRFTSDAGRLGFIRPFPWMEWLETPRGRELAGSPDAVASATTEEVANLLTAIIRSERFSDGSIAGAHEKGLLLACARRAAVLAEALDRWLARREDDEDRASAATALEEYERDGGTAAAAFFEHLATETRVERRPDD